MATNGAQEAYAPGDVLAALTTMRGSEQDTKKRAHEFLENFQKSVRHPGFSGTPVPAPAPAHSATTLY